MRHATMLVAILASVPLAGAAAQMRLGERVRVTHAPICPPNGRCVRGWQRTDGTLLSVSGDTVVLSTDDGAARVLLPLIETSKIQVIRDGNARGGGAAIGALVGGAVGLWYGLTVFEETNNTGGRGLCCGNMLLGWPVWPVGGVLGGALVGALVGNFITIDRWVDVPLNDVQMDVTASPHGGLGVRVSVGF